LGNPPKSPFTKGGFQVKSKTGLKVQNSHVGEKINNKMWLFSTLVAGILHKKKNLKDLIELRFEDLTPYPPLHEMERGNKGGEVKESLWFSFW
jgi:hypothetical protein